MQGARLRDLRRRPRRGSLERPVDGRLVRGSAFVVLLALLVAAFTVARAGPLPAPALPSSFDETAALSLTSQLASQYPNRTPGSPGDAGAARWLASTLALYGLAVETDAWRQQVPDLGTVELRNVAIVIPGSAPGVIAVVAHRDNSGVGAGANDDASGTAALIQLARAYSTVGTTSARPKPQHTLVFLSTDGGAYGGIGAARFMAASRFRRDVLAAVVLDGLAGRGSPRLDIAGDGGRSPAPALVRTAVARVAELTGRAPELPGVFRQLVDLGTPFAYGDQAPFLGHHVSAVRLTTADDSGRAELGDRVDRLDRARFAELGAAVQNLLGSLDGGIELVRGTAPSLDLRGRTIHGWAVELVLVSALVPFVAALVDLLARCRRLGISLAPALRALRRRVGFWSWVALLGWLGGIAGFLPRGAARPLPPDGPTATSWPLAGIAVLGGLTLLGWFVARRRLVPLRATSPGDELAGYAAGLAGLGAVGILAAATHPFALVFLLPSLYAWLWLPQATGSPWLRSALYGSGLAGAALELVSLSTRFHLGTRTPLYLAELVSVGYVPWSSALLALAWAAAAAQLGAVAAGRYGAYAGGTARPPRGIVREAVRRTVLAAQARRR